jgi:hypothetical protein
MACWVLRSRSIWDGSTREGWSLTGRFPSCSSLRCDTGVTQALVERFVFDINAGHRLIINHERLLDTQEVTGSSPVGPTKPSLAPPGEFIGDDCTLTPFLREYQADRTPL